MNRHGYYETKGKQTILFGNAALPQIIAITLLFLLNVALVMAADCFWIHSIPADESGKPMLEAHVPGQIQSMKPMDGGYLILYRMDNGSQAVAKATDNVLNRFHLDPDVAEITEDPYIQDGVLLDFTVQGGQIAKVNNISFLSSRYELGAVIALCFMITALERMLFQKLRGY